MTHTAKHTPGPWVIDDYFDVATVNGTVIVRPPLSTLERNRMHPSERKANAHLIAAAPAMYEALRQAYAHLAEMGCDCEEGQSCGDCIVCQCETALSQAEGRDK